MLFYSREAVCYSAYTNTLDVIGIVSGPAIVVILPVFNTIVYENRKENRGRILGVHSLYDLVAFDFYIYEMVELSLECTKKFIKRAKSLWIAGFYPNPFSGQGVITIV